MFLFRLDQGLTTEVEFLRSVSHAMDNVVREFIGGVEHEDIHDPPPEIEIPQPDVPAPNAEIDIAENVAEADDSCIVCLGEAAQRHAIVPCGHGPICLTCVEELNVQEHNRCPYCRAVIDQIMTVYF